jgi:hypothetical protein
MKTVLSISTALFMLCLTGCFTIGSNTVNNGNQTTVVGSGNAQTEQRTVSAFTGIVTQLPIRTTVICQQSQSVAVTIDDNLLEYIQTDVVDGKLRITTRPNVGISIRSSASQIAITVPQLSSVEAQGSGDVSVSNCNAPAFDIRLTGSGNITVSGTTQTLTVNSTGSGSIRTRDLVAVRATVGITGSGNAVVFASQTLNATITGSGNIIYFGNPGMIQRTVTGSGNISKGD